MVVWHHLPAGPEVRCNMQPTTNEYQQILATNHTKQTRLVIGEPAGEDNIFGENMLYSIKTSMHLFSADNVVIGSCVSGEIDITMVCPEISIPRRAKLIPYVRLTDGERYSEWIQKGVFYIDTRQVQDKGNGIKKLIIHGYDAMLLAEKPYATSNLNWPARDIDVVQEIAAAMEVDIDPRTLEYITQGYSVQLPAEYTYRETLGYIAAMYAGCFIMSDLGALRFVPLWDLTSQFSYLVTEKEEVITAGGVSILVW